jgi:putative MFS transporter
MPTVHVLADRRHLWAFTVGCIAVTVGVVLLLPMFWMGRDSGFHLADMPMDASMWWGMALIVVGIAVAGYGLLPRAPVAAPSQHQRLVVSAPEDAPLGRAHWKLMLVLTVALVIDEMKPASLGFVVPGMKSEYGVSKAMVAWLPFAALCGTVVGSVPWGVLADLYGRRASILLSAVMFVGTLICGAVPAACCRSPTRCSPRPCRRASAAGCWWRSAGWARSAATSPRAASRPGWSRF